MTRISHLLREIARNLYRNPGTAFSSFLSLTLLFLLFDLFWVAAGTSDVFYRDLLSDIRMEVFLNEEVTDSLVPDMEFRVAQVQGVQAIERVTKEQAREELSRLVGTDLLAGYDTTNPLPRSFILSFAPEYLNSSVMESIEEEVAGLEGVSEVYYGHRWLRKAESARAIILRTGMVLGALILLTALVSSANNIRWMTRARAAGFQQMRLLGAGKLFVAFPFLVEGFLMGGISAAVGWALIYFGRQKIAFSQFEIIVPTTNEIVIFCCATALLGVISGYFGVRKLLK